MPEDFSQLVRTEKRHIWHPFTPMDPWCDDAHEPLMLVSGKGCWLRDQHGRDYIDGNSSIWTNIHGHSHPTILAFIRSQLERVAHTSFLGFTHAPAAQLAHELVHLMPESGLNRVFYSDNGSTAIEAAVRMAFQYHRQTGDHLRNTILAFENGYHGDTLGAASLGGLGLFKGVANDFGYKVVRVSRAEQLEKLNASEIAAAIIEPLIQGAAGMRLWPPGLLKQLREWCSASGVLLIADEVMTGFGRTGKLFACQHEDVVPDFLCLAKGLTGGYLPLAVTMTTDCIFDAFRGDPSRAFYYGHSYTANQLGCAAALGNLQVFRDEQTMLHLASKVARFGELAATLSGVADARVCGMIAGIELSGPVGLGAKVCLAAREYGLLTRPIGNVIVLMPPLCVSLLELETMFAALQRAIDTALA
ncbi:MAG: adenosylmethionine--8-amino-7-oxononanoate transaminase [Verrucomicrobiaceae bacterium]|nr:adenosylmethionine--8-amino-7-oxononanoate transaminase [Verrucomicrobiaceae bacterium]